jgi:hypothetical protein
MASGETTAQIVPEESATTSQLTGQTVTHNQPVLQTTLSTSPLTTTFTPPPSCLAPTWTLGQDIITSSSQGSVTYTSVFRGYQSSCYPPSFIHLLSVPEIIAPTAAANVTFSFYLVVYSPGTLASGYTVAQVSYSNGTAFSSCCPSYAFSPPLEKHRNVSTRS